MSKRLPIPRRLRARFLRWSKHTCRTRPASTPVQFDLPCRCGWHVTGVIYASTDGEFLMKIGAPIQTHDLRGPLTALLDHYDSCPSRRP